jgi:hypothetical protein
LRLESPRYDLAAVAQKAGKGTAFVAQRQHLVELIPSIAEAFLADQVGVDHALQQLRLLQTKIFTKTNNLSCTVFLLESKRGMTRWQS